MSDTDDIDELASLATGEETALQVLFRRHSRAVYWYAVSIVEDPDTAEDVVQATFLTLWNKRSTFTAYVGSVLPWLLVTAKNHSRNAVRASRRRHHLADAEADMSRREQTDPAEVAAQTEAAAEVQAAIDSLLPLERKIFRLCIEEELPYKQAAARLGLTHGAVRNRLSRLRRSLQVKLGSSEGENS